MAMLCPRVHILVQLPCIKNTHQQRWITIKAAANKEQPSKLSEDERLRSGPFGFVTDNQSSRTSLQMPNEPWQDGNVGQMISEIKDKGKDYGSFVDVGEFTWFVRETGSRESNCGTIIFLHGAPAHSYSYRNVMSQMSKAGYLCIAPDWIGFGFSQAPQPGYGFSYTEEAYHAELDKLLAVLKIDYPFILASQGYVVGSYGFTWALKNRERLYKMLVFNSPITNSASIPVLFYQLKLPFVGEFVCQDALMAERFIEKGSAYVLKLEKADVYRLPYLASSRPGFAVLEATRKASLKDLASRIFEGFSSKSGWNIATSVIWGEDDKFLGQSEGVKFANANPDCITLISIPGAGHMPQEDWPEKVVEALLNWLT